MNEQIGIDGMKTGFLLDPRSRTGHRPRAAALAISEIEAEAEADLRSLLPRGAIGGARYIQDLDANYLSLIERADLTPAAPKNVNASGAARAVARTLMAAIGHDAGDIRRGPDRAPIWPDGLIGSLSHSQHIAMAAIARSTDVEALGIDIEPSDGIEPELAQTILTPGETRVAEGDPLFAHACFAIKEAVYKAVYPRDRTFLEFRDVELDFETGTATTSYDRTISWACNVSTSIIAVAWTC